VEVGKPYILEILCSTNEEQYSLSSSSEDREPRPPRGPDGSAPSAPLITGAEGDAVLGSLRPPAAGSGSRGIPLGREASPLPRFAVLPFRSFLVVSRLAVGAAVRMTVECLDSLLAARGGGPGSSSGGRRYVATLSAPSVMSSDAKQLGMWNTIGLSLSAYM
jgi:hypothetical protein